MEKRSNMTKILVVVLLFVALAAVAVFQFMRLRPQPVEAPPAQPQVQAEQAAPQPGAPAEKPVTSTEAGVEAPVPEGAAAEAEKPAEAPAGPAEPAPAPQAPAVGGKPAGTPAPAAEPKPPEAKTAAKGAPPGEPAAPPKRPEREKELPKISFMDEEVDKQFRASRFFTMNSVVPSKNPFVPMRTFVPLRALGGKPEQLGSGASMLSGGASAGGEIPLLPLPGETLGEVIPVKLIGVSSGSQTATALFEVDGIAVLAHPGWLVGNDYVFVGAQFGKANLFDRKSNRIIQLASGETL